MYLLTTCTTVLPRQLPIVLQQLLQQYTAGGGGAAMAALAAAGGRPGMKAATAMLFRAAQQKPPAVSLACNRLLQRLDPERYQAVQTSKAAIREVRKVHRQPVGKRAVLNASTGGVGGEGGGDGDGEVREDVELRRAVDGISDGKRGSVGQWLRGASEGCQNEAGDARAAASLPHGALSPPPPHTPAQAKGGAGTRPQGKVKYVRLPHYVCHACEVTTEGEDPAGRRILAL